MEQPEIHCRDQSHQCEGDSDAKYVSHLDFHSRQYAPKKLLKTSLPDCRTTASSAASQRVGGRYVRADAASQRRYSSETKCRAGIRRSGRCFGDRGCADDLLRRAADASAANRRSVGPVRATAATAFPCGRNSRSAPDGGSQVCAEDVQRAHRAGNHPSTRCDRRRRSACLAGCGWSRSAGRAVGRGSRRSAWRRSGWFAEWHPGRLCGSAGCSAQARSGSRDSDADPRRRRCASGASQA